MSGPFQPGDVVVCVYDGPGLSGTERPMWLRRGALYRIAEVLIGERGRSAGLLGLAFVGINHFPYRGVDARRFRKIDDEVTEEFREQLRKLPVREQSNV